MAVLWLLMGSKNSNLKYFMAIIGLPGNLKAMKMSTKFNGYYIEIKGMKLAMKLISKKI